MIRSFSVMGLIALFAIGCASSGGGGSSAAEEPASAEMAIPADSPLAKITLGMNDEQVRAILGSPDASNAYMTGKSWIPFYYGSDTSRTDWLYAGQGRVVYSRNRYSGGLKVIRVMYDPNDSL